MVECVHVPPPLDKSTVKSIVRSPGRCAGCSRSRSDMWFCLSCGYTGCGRLEAGHMLAHSQTSGHSVCINLASSLVWCYLCDTEVVGDSIDSLRRQLVGLSKSKQPQPAGAVLTPSGRGIRNIGNTCFLAASLQCLSHTDSFSNLLRSCPPYSSEELQQATPSQRLVVAVRNFLLSPGCEGPLDPSDILSSVQRMNALFHGYHQHDSQEFLRFLLTSIHDELKPSLVSTVFGGKTCSSVTCLSCQKESKCIEDFFDLSLPIPDRDTETDSSSSWWWSRTKTFLGIGSRGRVSLMDCFDQFTKTEHLKGDNAYFCESCKRKTDCLKRLSLHELPEVLVVHLKRFRHDWGVSKVGKQVTFPTDQELDLTAFMTAETSSALCQYRLQSIVQHIGSATSGHYVAYSKQRDNSNQWLLFDDSRVSLIPSVENTEAYVLFFERVASSEVLAERELLKHATEAPQAPVLLPKKWITQVNTMSRIPPLEADDVVCAHRHPSTTCPVHAKELFVAVSGDYAEQARQLYGKPDKQVSPLSLEPCKLCAVYLSAYNHRLSMEHKLVTKLDTKDIPEGDFWFFIDAGWVKDWRAYLKHSSIMDSSKGSSPGPVRTKKLIEQIKKKTNLKITSDFVAVNFNVWSVFVHCHGSDGPALTGKRLDIATASETDSKPEPQLPADEWDAIAHDFVDIRRALIYS